MQPPDNLVPFPPRTFAARLAQVREAGADASVEEVVAFLEALHLDDIEESLRLEGVLLFLLHQSAWLARVPPERLDAIPALQQLIEPLRAGPEGGWRWYRATQTMFVGSISRQVRAGERFYSNGAAMLLDAAIRPTPLFAAVVKCGWFVPCEPPEEGSWDA